MGYQDDARKRKMFRSRPFLMLIMQEGKEIPGPMHPLPTNQPRASANRQQARLKNIQKRIKAHACIASHHPSVQLLPSSSRHTITTTTGSSMDVRYSSDGDPSLDSPIRLLSSVPLPFPTSLVSPMVTEEDCDEEELGLPLAPFEVAFPNNDCGLALSVSSQQCPSFRTTQLTITDP